MEPDKFCSHETAPPPDRFEARRDRAAGHRFDTVVDRTGRLPPVPLTWTVAVGLVAAAGIVRAAGAGASPAVRAAGWVVSAVFLARGAVSIPADLAGGPEDAYQRLDLAIYSPLSLTLGAGTAAVLTSSRRAS
jgi:hypothetical protein